MKLNNEQNTKVLLCLVMNVKAGNPEHVTIQTVADFLTNTYKVDYKESRRKAFRLYRGYQDIINMKSEAA